MIILSLSILVTDTMGWEMKPKSITKFHFLFRVQMQPLNYLVVSV